MNVSEGFPYYIHLTEGHDIVQLFNDADNINLLSEISEEKSKLRYASGKWSIKQLVGHITDHERIMVYRALRFSRNDTTTLPGYDQDLFVDNSKFDEVAFSLLINDLKAVRAATQSFMKMLSDEQYTKRGLAWKFDISVEETLRATIGHEMHHISVIKEKYL